MTDQAVVTSSRDGTAKDFVEHWDWVASKGLLNVNTARALKAAALRILKIEGDGWESLDVRSLEPEPLLDRFENLAKKDFTPQSLSTYRSRFTTARRLYLSFLEDPKGYRPQARDRSGSADRSRSRTPTAAATSSRAGEETSKHSAAEEERINTQVTGRMVRYPFPIRAGVIAELLLPVDLNKPEAKRLAMFIDSVAMEG